jgi:hypothetical protein
VRNVSSQLDGEFEVSSALICSDAPESMMEIFCQVDGSADMDGKKRVSDPSQSSQQLQKIRRG